MTSPTATASRLSGSRNASYQSPPTAGRVTGQVAGVQRQAPAAGQFVWQQAALQGVRGGVLVLVHLGPLHGERALAGQRLEEDPFLLEDGARLAEGEAQRAERHARREQRKPHPGLLVAGVENPVARRRRGAAGWPDPGWCRTACAVPPGRR